MPIKSNKDLPKNLQKVLPVEAQTLFRETFNTTLEKTRKAATAMKKAWDTLKKEFKKGPTGKWIRK